ncbi:MAG: pyridoxal phosphate-dependent aminotransferase [Methanoculleaceae archaeon]
MKPLSQTVACIVPSATLSISERAARMRSEGVDVISLSIGEPDFGTPPHIRRACIEAIERGETHYAPSRGLPELVRAVAARVAEVTGNPVEPEGVIITAGAKDAIRQACQAILNPGDGAIIFDPSWVSYDPCVRMAGGRPVHIRLCDDRFQPDDRLLEAVGPDTKLIIVNTPSNPAGTVLDDDALRLIRDCCIDHDLYAISDEIYDRLIYGREHRSPASLDGMADRTVLVNGFSKAYAMTGWRLGYAAGPPEIISQMLKIQQHSVTSPVTFAMWGGVAALEGDQTCVEEMRNEFDRRRRLLLPALRDLGFRCAPAEGAFYAYVHVGGDEIVEAERWLNEAAVAVTPGSAFGTPGWLRVSYAASYSRIQEAIGRIRAIC